VEGAPRSGRRRAFRLADQASAEADGYCVRARARLQLGQKVADVRLHRLLREEEALADLAVYEAVRDQLENFDLAARRLLLELAQRARERDDLGLLPAVRAPRRDFVESARVPDVTAQDLLTLGGVHGAVIGGRQRPL
jgi:hypothetical protein